MSARTGYRAAVGIRRIVSQQLRQRTSSGLVYSRSQSSLDGFQIERAATTALLKNNPQEAVYFAGHCLLHGLRRFFSAAVCTVCSTGRKRQIFRLTSTNSPVRAWNLTKLSDLTFRLTHGGG